MSTDITNAIEKAIKTKITALVEEEVQAASERLNRRVQDLAGEIAVTVGRHVNFQEDSNSITVRVDTSNLKAALGVMS